MAFPAFPAVAIHSVLAVALMALAVHELVVHARCDEFAQLVRLRLLELV